MPTVHAWIVLGSAVLLLNLGLGIYQSGISRGKNAASAAVRFILHLCVAILAFWAFGFAILSGEGGNAFDAHNVGSAAIFLPAIICAVPVIAAGGSILERSRIWVGIVFSMLLAGFLIPLAWRLAWSARLQQWGFVDFAGASFLHLAGGMSALVAAILLGPRLGKYNKDGSTNAVPGHNIPLMCAGIGLIFAAWGPLVLACAEMRDDTVNAPLGIILAPAAAACVAAIYSHVRFRRLEIQLVCAGMLGGLVAISGGGEVMSSLGAFLTGIIAGLIVPMSALWIETRWRIDDPANSAAIFGIGGLWGTIAAGLLARGAIGDVMHRLWPQIIVAGIVLFLAFVLTFGVLFLLKAIANMRPSEAVELEGLDLAEHDLNAYPDFQQTTIKSYHLREM